MSALRTTADMLVAEAWVKLCDRGISKQQASDMIYEGVMDVVGGGLRLPPRGSDRSIFRFPEDMVAPLAWKLFSADIYGGKGGVMWYMESTTPVNKSQ